MQVLLVDDEPEFLSQAELLLKREEERFEIDTATSASEGLENLERNRYDAVVSDYQMPGMNGLEFLKKVREEKEIDVPFIIFTGQGHEEVAMEALNQGADRYFQKNSGYKIPHKDLARSLVREINRYKESRKSEKSVTEMESMLNSISDQIIYQERDGRIVRVNEATANAFNFSKGDMMGRYCYRALRGRQEPCDDCPVRKAVETGEFEEKTMSFPDEGSVSHVKGNPLRDSEGNVVGVVAVRTDISELMDKKGIFGTCEESKDSLLASSSDSIYMVDENCHYISMNSELLSRLGESRENVIGKHFGDFHSEEETDEFVDNVQQVLETGENLEHEHETDSGKWYLRTLNPVKDLENGGVSAVTVVSKDITRKKRVEERESFLHSLLRHDVRNKAQIAQGYHELLKEDEQLSEKGEKFLSKANRAVRDSIDLIEKVRTLRQVEDEKVGEISINNQISKSISASQPQGSKNGIEIVKEDFRYEVKGGPLLEQLFNNLIENSMVHSGCDKIRISGREEEDSYVVSVEDDGKGIPEEVKGNLFERGFKRGDEAGSGLGLFLVEKIAERYGGKVEIGDSEMGGARFDVYLEKA